MFLHHCRKRRIADIQTNIIKQPIKPGSVIKKDCWKAFISLNKDFFIIAGKPLGTFCRPKFRCSYKNHRTYLERIGKNVAIKRNKENLVRQSFFTLLYSKTITYRFHKPITIYKLSSISYFLK